MASPSIGKYIAWGGWYHDLENGDVLTTISGGKEWRTESYRLLGDFLHWFTGHGLLESNLVEPEEFPAHLMELVEQAHRKIDETDPPPFPTDH